MKHNTLMSAIALAELGFRVLPLRPGTKVPDLRHWPEEAGRDPDTIRRHFELSSRRHAGAQPNVGIVTGDGLAVVDIDTHHGGEIPSWLDTKTAAVKTASGGLHYYYSVAGPVPNSVGRIASGVDIRGERGQVAAPPSIITLMNPSGFRPESDSLPSPKPQGVYRWINDLPIARIDYDLLVPEDQKRDFTGTRRTFDYRDEVPVGERNNYLTSLAGYLFATDEGSPSEVLAALQTEVVSLGFTPREGEIESIVRSVARYH